MLINSKCFSGKCRRGRRRTRSPAFCRGLDPLRDRDPRGGPGGRHPRQVLRVRRNQKHPSQSRSQNWSVSLLRFYFVGKLLQCKKLIRECMFGQVFYVNGMSLDYIFQSLQVSIFSLFWLMLNTSDIRQSLMLLFCALLSSYLMEYLFQTCCLRGKFETF